MKKLFLILALIILGLPVFSENTEPIKDELLDPSMYEESSVFKLGIYKHGEYHYIPIEDELVDGDFISKASNFAIERKEHPDDLFFEKFIDPSKVRKILPKTKYDFTKQQIPIHIQLAQKFKTKGLLEGTVIPFIATHDFEIKGKTFKKGTTVLGRVETLSASDKMGVPETLKIDNFYIEDGNEEINLHGSVSKTGANRSIWVYPLYQAGNITFYVAGFVFVPIHGGRAKISTTESFTVFFETQ
jgi:hypothetical protein